jgi:glycosyltransferase involved in cell wall biosynthesis
MISEALQQRGVLFVTRKWPPAIGGMETYSVELTRELAGHVPVEIVSLPGRSNGRPPRALALAGFALAVARRFAHRQFPPAILHVGDLAAWPLGLLAWTRRGGTKVVISAHGTDVGYHRRRTLKGRLYRSYLRLGAKLIGRATLISNSAATAAVAAETGWRTVKVIPLATRAEPLPAPPDHGSHLLFAGRLLEQKGCAWFIRSVLPLLPEEIGLKVAGTVWDETERAALGDSRVSYVGALDKNALVEEYRRALCVILPNIELPSGLYEGFGLVAPEAAAAGGVVVAAATGGLSDAVIDGETGFLVVSGNGQEWAEKIVEISRWTDSARQSFVERSMKRAREVFSWSRVADDVLSVYEGISRAVTAAE